MRKAFFDIECNHLNADWGLLICARIKWSDKKTIETFRITDHKQASLNDDRGIAKAIRDSLEDADTIVTWYGKKFDVPYLQSRLLKWGETIMSPNISHLDLWATARYQLRLSSNRLANIERFLELDATKTPINQGAWIEALAGSKKHMKTVVDHCKQDVLMLEEAYNKMLPLIKNHPHVALKGGPSDGCPKCGSISMEKMGYRVTKVRRYQRWRCLDCGSTCSTRVQDKREPLKFVA